LPLVFQTRRLIANPAAKTSLSSLLSSYEGDRGQINALADLLDKMLALDPDKRIEPDAALRHPFVREFLPKKKEGH
jgi:serine/threonine-protein kinase PRP4